jgi:hypothetical protein
VAEQKGDDRNALVLFCLFGGTRLRGERAVANKTARLKALRLAKEEADRQSAVAKKTRQRKSG